MAATEIARKILIDGTMAVGGGGFTYLVNILPRLARMAPDTCFRVLVRSERLVQSIDGPSNLEVELLPAVGLLGRLRFTYLEIPRLAAAWGADLYFSAGESAPLRAPCPTIASFRNPNVFTDLDQGWRWKQRIRLTLLRALTRLSAWACDRIMFVSHDSADWIGDSLGLPRQRRAVVHHGIDPSRWQPQGDKSPSAWPYILSVSSIYRYKNFVALIEGYAELARRLPEVPDLVIIGDDQDPEYSRKMQEARLATGDLAERIQILGEVPYAEIPAYYAGAELFVFPSYLETFGHPLLEAMAADIPVVAADIPVFREIGSDAAFYADPHDATSLATAMEEALAFPEAREMLVKRGRRVIEHFSWDRSATQLLGLFREVLNEQDEKATGTALAAHEVPGAIAANSVTPRAA
jgi:glycosyltransferase involved in cell wall biosynthesis